MATRILGTGSQLGKVSKPLLSDEFCSGLAHGVEEAATTDKKARIPEVVAQMRSPRRTFGTFWVASRPSGSHPKTAWTKPRGEPGCHVVGNEHIFLVIRRQTVQRGGAERGL